MEIKNQWENITRPGNFSHNVAADARRNEFDAKNQVILTHNIPVDFVFIGDSNFHRWELNAYFGRSSNLIFNRAIGGDSSEYVLKRFKADVLQLKPRYAVLQVGANDTYGLEINPYYPDQIVTAEEVLSKVTGNITAIVDLCIEAGQKLVICSVMPLAPSAGKEYKELVLGINKNLMELTQKKGMIYVDIYSSMVCEDGLTRIDGLTIEGVHMNVFGYDIMAKVLRETLGKHGIVI